MNLDPSIYSVSPPVIIYMKSKGVVPGIKLMGSCIARRSPLMVDWDCKGILFAGSIYCWQVRSEPQSILQFTWESNLHLPTISSVHPSMKWVPNYPHLVDFPVLLAVEMCRLITISFFGSPSLLPASPTSTFFFNLSLLVFFLSAFLLSYLLMSSVAICPTHLLSLISF